MPLLAFGITWMGYALLVLGVATVRGCNISFSAVALPGKYTGCNPDPPNGAPAPSSPQEGSANAQGVMPQSKGTNPLQAAPSGGKTPPVDYNRPKLQEI